MNSLKNLSKLIKSTPKVQQEIPAEIVANPLEIGEKQFLKREKYYTSSGPMHYVSKLLQQKGPLTSHQIWGEFVRDKTKTEDSVLRSKTHLKQQVMKKMLSQGRIEKVGYDKKKKTFLGFRIVPEIAFKNTHPDDLLMINPQPQINRMMKPDILYRKEQLEQQGLLGEEKEQE